MADFDKFVRRKDKEAERRHTYKGKATQINPFLTLEENYKKIAKKADAKLRALEKAAASGRKDATSYAYEVAMENIRHFSGEGAKRFNTKAPRNQQQLQRKINDILDFLNSPTSTVKGIDEVYEKRTKTFNEHWGTNFSSDEIGRLFESGMADKLDKKLGYGNSLVILGEMQQKIKKGDYGQAFKRFLNKNQKASQEDINNWIIDRLTKQGLKGVNI